jgi:hypothetical protein
MKVTRLDWEGQLAHSSSHHGLQQHHEEQSLYISVDWTSSHLDKLLVHGPGSCGGSSLRVISNI